MVGAMAASGGGGHEAHTRLRDCAVLYTQPWQQWGCPKSVADELHESRERRTVLQPPRVVSSSFGFWQKLDLSQQSMALPQPLEPCSMHCRGGVPHTSDRLVQTN